MNIFSDPLPEHGTGNQIGRNSYSRWHQNEISLRTINESENLASNVVSESLSEHDDFLEILIVGGFETKFQYE